MRIAVLLTCHNRCETTLRCLEAVYANRLPEEVVLHSILVDDGSTDGTEAAVRDRYPLVEVVKGAGDLFWSRGMHKAFATALEVGFDYYLWLNDDTVLDQEAVMSLVRTSRNLKDKQGMHAIVVGSTRDKNTGKTTYGGVTRNVVWKRTTFTLAEPGELPMEVESMNGNCVLIPHVVAAEVGNLDPSFAHAMGDTDYGLRARQAGFSIWIVSGYVGTCTQNIAKGDYNDRSLSLRARLHLIMQPKGLPPDSWKIFTKRHAGIFWFLFWIWPYFRLTISSIRFEKTRIRS